MTAQSGWLQIGLSFVPWLALIVAIGSATFAGMTYRIARRQAIERLPQLVISLDNLWFSRKDGGARDYELAVLMTNRAVTANTVTSAELVITLALPTGHELRLRIPAARQTEGPTLPLRLESYASVPAKLVFHVQAGLVPAGSSIKSHAFEFSETSGSTYTVEPRLVSERRDDAAQDSQASVQK